MSYFSDVALFLLLAMAGLPSLRRALSPRPPIPDDVLPTLNDPARWPPPWVDLGEFRAVVQHVSGWEPVGDNQTRVWLIGTSHPVTVTIPVALVEERMREGLRRF